VKKAWENKPIYSRGGHFKQTVLYCLVIGFLVLCCALQARAGAKGEVTSVDNGYVQMDIGAEQGVKVGDTGKVYYTVLIGEERESRSIYVASFTITGAFKESAVAKIQEAQGQVMVGYLVEITGETIQAQKKEPPAKVTKTKKEAQSSLKPGQVWRDPLLRMSFVWVPGGCFEMGCGDWSEDCSDNERPAHRVCVNGFWMARHEVTQGQWERIMGHNPSGFKRCGSLCPVEKVSWNEALEFASQLTQKTGYTFRLPTEAEWEYACRSGGREEPYAGGGPLDAAAWYRSNAEGGPHQVGRKQPNGLGIYDMSGNVWEWCLDVSDKQAYSKAKDTLEDPVFIGGQYADIYGEGYDNILRTLKDASGYRIVRGGSWGNVAYRLRCSARIRGKPDSRRDWLGFRLVRELKRR
jgi:formylglycine-generating enzyme required for sulfatase activity